MATRERKVYEKEQRMPSRVWILAGEDEPLAAFAFDEVQAASSGASYVRADLHDELRRLAQAVVFAQAGIAPNITTGGELDDAIEALRTFLAAKEK
jgi:hypothetical protein